MALKCDILDRPLKEGLVNQAMPMLVCINKVLLGNAYGGKGGAAHWALIAIHPLLHWVLLAMLPHHMHGKLLLSVKHSRVGASFALSTLPLFLTGLVPVLAGNSICQFLMVLLTHKSSSKQLWIQIIQKGV